MERAQNFTVSCGGKPTGNGMEYGTMNKSRVNLNQVERVLSGLLGAFLFKRNIGRFTLPGVAKTIAGSALLHRGITGHCNLYESLQVSSTRDHDVPTYSGASTRARHIHGEMTVQVPPMEAYQLWRDPANQSWIMGHFARVDSLSLDRARWKLRAPVGLEWDALIVADSPGEFLSWESIPGAGIPNEGVVRFQRTETGGTRLSLDARFDPPAGSIGMCLMNLIGVTPETVVTRALQRFKSLAESGGRQDQSQDSKHESMAAENIERESMRSEMPVAP